MQAGDMDDLFHEFLQFCASRQAAGQPLEDSRRTTNLQETAAATASSSAQESATGFSEEVGGGVVSG